MSAQLTLSGDCLNSFVYAQAKSLSLPIVTKMPFDEARLGVLLDVYQTTSSLDVAPLGLYLAADFGAIVDIHSCVAYRKLNRDSWPHTVRWSAVPHLCDPLVNRGAKTWRTALANDWVGVSEYRTRRQINGGFRWAMQKAKKRLHRSMTMRGESDG